MSKYIQKYSNIFSIHYINTTTNNNTNDSNNSHKQENNPIVNSYVLQIVKVTLLNYI